jgi:hypothetical protein
MVALELACKFTCEMFADILKKLGGGGFSTQNPQKTQKNNRLK